MTKLLYTTNTDSDDISVVDPNLRQEIDRITIGGSPRGSVKFDNIKDFGYVSNTAGNTISVIDLKINKEVNKIKVGQAPRGLMLSENGKFAYVSNSGSDTLSIVDLTKGEQIGEITMGRNPRHMGLLPNKNKLLVCNWGSDAIVMLDFTLEQLTPSSKTISVGKNARPYSLTVNSEGDKAYVANTQANYMSIIDLDNNKENREENRVEVGYGGRAIVLSKNEKYAFISVENTNEIVSVNLENNLVANRAEVGPSPRGITLDHESNELFVSEFTRSKSNVTDKRNILSIVNVSNPEEIKYSGDIEVGLGPCSVSLLKR
jgi:YVTN family beta-propeller protein